MVLRNYVTLEEGKAAVMHFRDHYLEDRNIVDPSTRREKGARALVFEVDRLGGESVSAQFSTLSEKLAQTLEPYLEEKTYINYTFIITRRGRGYATEYEVQVTPFGG